MAERPEDEVVAREEAAAASDAARVGGEDPEPDADPASRPVEEAGGGVAEGFEQAEEDLVEHAAHGEERYEPTSDAFTPEEESDRASAAYAEPDEIDPTEVVEDPREGADDPGRGPGIAPDR